ncbi:probable ATP-dependent RNA helicase DDX58 [Strongylocentrotus purpuratus]|uniref:RNA helicase n=1 Tax=Strongylocentrotus purpuratus TaxID=7668 RepID=A0A7M7NS29_STRPU|nr:probable ATP-dependent RNA helicase DDX58 [Strongylocentrotus purpuratus]
MGATDAEKTAQRLHGHRAFSAQPLHGSCTSSVLFPCGGCRDCTGVALKLHDFRTISEQPLYGCVPTVVCCQTIDSRMLMKVPGEYQVYVTTGLDNDADFDKRSLLRTVEVCTPSESSASITKNMDFQSDVTDEDSMVTSAMSHSDYSMSVKKDSKFDESGSGSEKPSESRSTGLTHGLRQLSVKPTSDPGRVTGWLNEAEAVRQPMIGAPGADRLPVKSIDDMETLKLKIYQEELAEPALQGHNTCVVAPTGSGKTYVAVAVAQEVLRKSPGKKVIFVVNQVPLVHQQSTVFKKYIKDVAYICGDHGQPEITRLPMDEVLKENDVVVLTAQILVDALTKGQVSFNQIGLIVLDECHETKKKSQYNAIMAKYMEQKMKNEKPLPQILGMTASLGVGNAHSDKNAIQYMLKMCANMDVVKLSTVQKHKESLEKVINKPEEVTSRTKDSFAEEIQDLMYQVFKYINSSPGSSVLSTTVEKLSSLRSSNHSRENFSHVLCKLQKEIADNSQFRDLQLSLMTCVQYLKEYSTTLAFHETARTKDALQYLQEFIREKSNKAVTTNTEKMLIQTFQDKQHELERISMSPKSLNPALVELQNMIERDIVTCHTNENGDSFRAILFTPTITSTSALRSWVMETDSLKDLNPEVLVGCRNPGMNLRHQTNVLDYFRNGVHKLLIATSVLQQGIDVQACNFVYRYNYIGDAVARIQARGRTRKPGGRFDLVTHGYRGLDVKDKLSKEQEQIMQRATDAVSSLSIEQMKRGTAVYQQQRNVQIFNQQQQRKPLDEGNQSYHCKDCDALVCHSADIRIVPGGHHVVIHRQIFSKIRIVASGGNGQDPGHWSSVEHANKEIRCAGEGCHTKLGSILKCSNRILLAFSIKSLRLRNTASTTKTYRTWGSLPFVFHKVPFEEGSFGLNDIPGIVA